MLEEKVGKKLPFSVPDNYFEDFALKMDEQIAQKNVRKFRQWWMYSAAAVFVGVLLVGQIIYSDYKQQITYQENYETYVLSQVGDAGMMYYYMNEE